MSEEDKVRIAEQYYEALNSHDYDRASTHHGEGYQFQAPEMPTPVDNEGNRAHFQQMIDMCSDLAMNVSQRIADGDYVVVNFVAAGTNDGALTSPTGDAVPPTGRKVSLPVSNTLQFKEGKIARSTLYYDQMTVMAQLGLMPGM
jgi:steroid delta-isomerase-like uncharacterized protein